MELGILKEIFTIIQNEDPIVKGLIISILIIALVTTAIFKVAQELKKNFEERLKIIEKSELSLNGEKKDKEKKEENEEFNLVNVYMKLNSMLKSSMKDNIEEVGAERLAIYLFHNGVHALNGFPFMKMSCICEIIARYSLSDYKQVIHTNIPINAISDFIDELYHKKIYIVDKEKKDEGDSLAARFIIGKDLDNSFIAISIVDTSVIDEPIIGFLLAEFRSGILKSKDLEFCRESLIRLAEEASYTLQISNFIKKSGKELP